MNELADLAAICGLPGYGECSVELTDAVLEEGAKFAEACWRPSTSWATRAPSGRTAK
ncbi:Uncharacterised protein [Chromobacterium violaceum]|uniref:Uncharacterized protein n=1 Tax=Chromobacterium violaceum TaxID=536 RepID=A0A447TJL1_CHRVL|nr:Uncharacterised protein [Chromobacterium violaceum]